MSTNTTASPETEAEKFVREHIEDLKHRVKRMSDSESLLSQSKALASLISNLAESPSVIDHEIVGSIGGMMEDQLTRLELALAIEDQQKQHTKIGKALVEVING